MKKSKLSYLFAATMLLGGTAQAKVVINEFSYDDFSSDNTEFIELYNSGSAAVNLNGWKIQVGSNQSPKADSTPSGIEKTFTFDSSHSIPADGYFLIATNNTESAIINTQYGSAVNVVMETSTDTAVRNLSRLRNYKGFVTLTDNNNQVSDSVVWARNENYTVVAGDQLINGTLTTTPELRAIPAGHGEPASNGTPNSGGGIYGYLLTAQKNTLNGQLLPIGAATGEQNSSLTFQRSPDLNWFDTDNNELDFFMAMPTPGDKNMSKNLINPADLANEIVFNFDGVAGSQERKLAGTYYDCYVQNPGLAPSAIATTDLSPNTSVIPPSPQGGNVGVHWNHQTRQLSGGTASSMHFSEPGVLSLTSPVKNIEVETYVYIGPALTDTIKEGGSFAVLRGRPDAHPLMVNHLIGDNGIRLSYENNVSQAGKYIVKFGRVVNGVETLFGDPVEVTTPGWYRVLVSVNEDKTVAYLGGAFGNYTSADGNVTGGGVRWPAAQGQYYTTTILRPGTVGYNYSYIPVGDGTAANKSTVRPATFDRLTYRLPSVIPNASVDDWKIY